MGYRNRGGQIPASPPPEVTATPFQCRQIPSDEEIAIPPDIDIEDTFPEGCLQAWLVVLSAFLFLFPSFGFMVAIGVLQDYWTQNQLSSYSSRDVGWIPSVFVYLSLALGLWFGPLFDRYGPRWLALLGSGGYLGCMFLLAECDEFWQFLLCCGFLGGVTGATLTTTSLAVVAHWFKMRRGLAQGVAMAGSSFGGLTIPLILRSALPAYGYRWSIRILGFVFLGCLVIGNCLMKARIPPMKDAKGQGIISLSIFGDLGFSLLTISVFGFEVVHFGALGILPTFVTHSTEFPPNTGFYLIAILGGVSCLGRLIPGYVADRIGRFNTLLIMIIFTLAWMLILWLPFADKSIGALYAFAALFGFGMGSWMALTPVCIGQLCRAEEFGRYYGTLYFIASLAMLICIPISGELIDVVGPKAMILFFCAITALSLVSLLFSRWACLGRRWTVMVKI
ncbi:major facilitator superfamily domain-containing protein [Pseudomassariella vexata]|uniref:Major facilitator superfamily domain-containing protein n=1 Tax=Pseudomassariella vexata TaxID=1141098 RepID=A0A1Y2DGT8_9PEZI|nr:major facilitator superfamily domain-containing protein [Pseudomassariella vexata]ORY58480.1 major facilitator superfamily domain-containing protein [Pseudomassariella vexata]